MVAKRAADEEYDITVSEHEPEYDTDKDLPTYDEWKRYDDQLREHEEQRHGLMYSYARYGY
jgi:hypothetical protein